MIKKQLNLMIDILDKTTLSSIIMISMIVSLLTLSIPIAAQTLVNFIAFGKLLEPVITLSIIVLVLMLALGALTIWQSVIIEIIQQKLMVKISLELTEHFTQLSLKNLSIAHGPELINRFFEVITIKKSISNLLLYGINLTLQLFFGLTLLLFYHPLFLLFDAFIIIFASVVIFLPHKSALKSAEEECTQKHKIAAWLEEILANRLLFRFNHYYEYAIHQTDQRLVSFLKIRTVHFKQLIKHELGFYLLAALTSSLLLGLGGYLVIQNQLSLGQLVAAEIVLGGLIYAFKRFNVLLENYYDLMASQHKIESILSLPIEPINTELTKLITPLKIIQIVNQDQEKVSCRLKHPLLICIDETQQQNSISEFILGFEDHFPFSIYINDILCTQEHRRALRQHALLVKENEWFSGTIYDNLKLNKSYLSTEEIKHFLVLFGLMNKIMNQPDGLKTIIYDWKTVFTELELVQLMIIRAILTKPQLLIIDRTFDQIRPEHCQSLFNALMALEKTLLIVITQDDTKFPFIDNHFKVL